MHIFIDESGTFSGAKEGAISVVGALVVPDVFLEKLYRHYGRVRRGLPLIDGEVKGRGLNEQQVARVTVVARRQLALFEATVVDAGLHKQGGILTYQQGVVDHLSSLLPKLNRESRRKTEEAIAQLKKMPAQLFLQAAATFSVLERVLQHAPLYFVQRYPKELGSFSWIIDGKELGKATAWEQWWSWYAQGVLAVRSKMRPGPHLEGADYSYHRKFETYDAKSGMFGTDMSLILADVRFVSGYDPGLEIVDILTNAVRRALTGKLGQIGWGEIPNLMIHRRGHYLEFMHLEGAGVAPEKPSYAAVVSALDRKSVV
jgi:hypothetical protein